MYESVHDVSSPHERMHPSPAFDNLPRPSQEEIRRAKLQDLCKLFDDFDADADADADAETRADAGAHPVAGPCSGADT